VMMMTNYRADKTSLYIGRGDIEYVKLGLYLNERDQRGMVTVICTGLKLGWIIF